MKEKFAPSLLIFFQKTVFNFFQIQNPRILDIGSGNYSIFEDINLNKKLVEALDIRTSSDSKNSSEINYLKGDITKTNSLKNNFYDLVFDSHCLHCLQSIKEQELALQNIYNSLKTDGIFASEMMVQPSGNKVQFPKRIVRDSIDIETLILNSGFKIIYFTIVPQMSFYFEHSEGEIVCDMLRVIAKK